MSITVVTAALVGLFVGTLINILADDLPDYQMPRLPHYPDGTPRPISAWMGITAFITGQRMPPAPAEVDEDADTLNLSVPVRPYRLSWRYPLVEIITATAFALTVVRAASVNTETPVNTLQTLFWLYYVAVFILLFVIDVEHRLILFSVIIPSSIIALIDAVLTPSSGQAAAAWMASAEPTLIDALIGGGVGFGVFFLFYAGGFLYARISAEVRGEELDEIAFGYGDVMLSTLCGLILGWRPLIFAMFITVFLGAAGAILFLITQKLRRGSGGMTTALPYGPYIIIGAALMLLFSGPVRDFLFNVVY